MDGPLLPACHRFDPCLESPSNRVRDVPRVITSFKFGARPHPLLPFLGTKFYVQGNFRTDCFVAN